MRKAIWIREYLALAVILVALVLLFGALSGRFLTTATFGAIANRIPTLALAATGMTLVLIVGGIDLSIGSVLALAGAVLGVALVDWHWPFAACAALAVAVGLVAGIAMTTRERQRVIFASLPVRARIHAMDLYIIRHAQSTNNALPAEIEMSDRVCDPLLTELGHRQAELPGRAPGDRPRRLERSRIGRPEAGGAPSVTSYGITRLVCSPMRRTLLTAQPISHVLEIRPEVWLDIHEHGGIYLDHGAPWGVSATPASPARSYWRSIRAMSCRRR